MTKYTCLLALIVLAFSCKNEAKKENVSEQKTVTESIKDSHYFS